MKSKQPGDLLQIDHMTVAMLGIGIVKHFSAICPVTKYNYARIYQEATARSAADFLTYLRQTLPFSIISIQVDEAAEFMAEFEEACFKAGIPLFVLPPRSPKLNGTIERNNRTLRREFYGQYDGLLNLLSLQKALDIFLHFYNFKRPHQSIQLLTPHHFYETLSNKRLSVYTKAST